MKKYKKIKKRIFDIIQIGQRGDFPSRAFDVFLVIVIVINIIALILSTYELPPGLLTALDVIETITVAFFGIEYLLRIWTANLLYPADSCPRAILKFLISFDGIVDLLSIIPAFFLTGFAAFRMLRAARIFHLFRINATYDSFNVITTVLHRKRKQILSSVFIIAVLMLASSLSMYSVEHEAQPEVFRNAFSGLWWSVSTILTVGYGDIYPVTLIGRIMAIIIAILGVGVVAIPTGIISAGFVEQHTKLENIMGAVNETKTLIKEATDSSRFSSPAENASHNPVISPSENLVERLLHDRDATDPETRKKFDQYIAELFRD